MQVPLNILFTFYTEKNSSAFVGAGVYAGRGIRGVETGSGYNNWGKYIIYDKVRFITDNPSELIPTNVKPVDAGYNLIAGVRLNRVIVSAVFSHGVTNVLSNADLYGGNYKNTTLGILLGYDILIKKL